MLLKLLVQEITASFLVLRITDLQPWIHGLPEWGCTIVGECDCSGQFNNVTPQSVMSDLKESVKWLSKKRRWNANELIWSIHRDNKSLDRAGMATSSRFTHLLHQDLENLVYFSPLTDTYTQASSRYGHKQGPSPWGDRSAPKVQT